MSTLVVALTILVAFAATAVAAMLAAEYYSPRRSTHTPRHAADGLSTAQLCAAAAEQQRAEVERERALTEEETQWWLAQAPVSPPWALADGLDEWETRELVGAA